MIDIDRTKCVGCGMCAADCVVNLLKMTSDGFPAVAPDDERFCINCQHCLAVCPSGALTCRGVSPSACQDAAPVPTGSEMAALLRQRRSIRRYKDKNLSSETLASLENILSWCPTGCNRRKLYFSIVTEKDEMAFYRNRMGKMLRFLMKTGILRMIYPKYKRYLEDIVGGRDVVFRGAPHMIVAAVSKDSPCREADPWIALSYFDLYARTLGVGTCWCGFALHAFKWDFAMRKRLKIPRGFAVSSVLLFGEPAVTYPRATSPERFEISEQPCIGSSSVSDN